MRYLWNLAVCCWFAMVVSIMGDGKEEEDE